MCRDSSLAQLIIITAFCYNTVSLPSKETRQIPGPGMPGHLLTSRTSDRCRTKYHFSPFSTDPHIQRKIETKGPLLLQAAANGDLQQIRALLADDIPITFEDRNRRTALMEAAEHGHTDVVSTLITAGAAVNHFDNLEGDTPLTLAAANGSLSVVTLLLSAGANVNYNDRRGATPLCKASANGHLAVVNKLLSLGATMNLDSDSPLLTLHKAAAGGHATVVKALLTAGAQADHHDKSDRTPLLWAAVGNHTAVMKQLLAARATMDQYEDAHTSPLLQAARKDNKQAVNFLLAHGAIPPTPEEVALIQKAIATPWRGRPWKRLGLGNMPLTPEQAQQLINNSNAIKQRAQAVQSWMLCLEQWYGLPRDVIRLLWKIAVGLSEYMPPAEGQSGK